MDWRRGQIIGYGSTSTVSLGSSPITSQLFAVKSAPLSKSQPLQLENHLFTSFITPSPYIISYLGHTISYEPPSYNLFIEYLPGGKLTQIHNPLTVQLYTWRILMGIHHLHSLGIVHGDIKPTNILIGLTGPKIADFGCAHLTRQQNSLSQHRQQYFCGGGTPLYMAPEVARGEKQDLASDIWSFGITIIEMITGKSPWLTTTTTDVDNNHKMSFNPMSFMYRIGYCSSHDDQPNLPEWLSQHGKDFLTKCLIRQPEQRWTAAELLKHPFINWLTTTTQGELGLFEEDEVQLQLQQQQLKFEFDSVNSPTSVLEQGIIWGLSENDDDEEDTSSSSLMMSSVVCHERIKGLLGLFHLEEMGLPKWDLDDQDWITIR